METDSSRKTAFADEIKNSERELGHLAMAQHIPDTFKEIKATVQDNAFGVLEAMLNLVGKQLYYLKTVTGKTGQPPQPIAMC